MPCSSTLGSIYRPGACERCATHKPSAILASLQPKHKPLYTNDRTNWGHRVLLSLLDNNLHERRTTRDELLSQVGTDKTGIANYDGIIFKGVTIATNCAEAI